MLILYTAGVLWRTEIKLRRNDCVTDGHLLEQA